MTTLKEHQGNRTLLRFSEVFDSSWNCFYFRAYGGDEDGSVYLQAFATFLQDHYLNIPLDRIYLMVKWAMIETKQVEDLLT